MYRPGHSNAFFNHKIFAMSLVKGIWTSMVVFFLPWFAMRNLVSSEGLDDNGRQFFATVVGGILVMAVNLQISLDTYSWTWINFVFVGLSFASWWIGWLMFYSIPSFAFYGVLWQVAANPVFYLSCIVTVWLVFLPIYSSMYLRIQYWCTPVEIVREMWKYHIGSEKGQTLEALPADDEEKGALVMTPLPTTSQTSLSGGEKRGSRKFKRSTLRKKNGALRDGERVTVNGEETGHTGYAFAHEAGWGEVVTRPEGVSMKEPPMTKRQETLQQMAEHGDDWQPPLPDRPN